MYLTEDLAQKELFSFSSLVLEGQCHPSSPAAPMETTWI